MNETLTGEYRCPAGRCHSTEPGFTCHHQAGYHGPRPFAKGAGSRRDAPSVRLSKAAPVPRYVDMIVATEIPSRYQQVVRVRGLHWIADAPFLADHDEGKVVGQVVRFWVEPVRWKGVPLGEALWARARLAPGAWGDACWKLVQRGERPAVSMGAVDLREVGPFVLRSRIEEVSVLTSQRGKIPGARVWSCFASDNEEGVTG